MWAAAIHLHYQGCLVQVGNGIELEAVGFQFEPYRWRPCGVTWDFVPNSRGNKAAANLRPIITFGARGNGHEYLLLSRSRPIYRALGVKFFLCGRATEKAISRTFYANDTAARPVARCGSLAIRRSLHLKRRRSVTVPMAAAILSLHSQCDSEAASLSEWLRIAQAHSGSNGTQPEAGPHWQHWQPQARSAAARLSRVPPTAGLSDCVSHRDSHDRHTVTDSDRLLSWSLPRRLGSELAQVDKRRMQLPSFLSTPVLIKLTWVTLFKLSAWEPEPTVTLVSRLWLLVERSPAQDSR